VIIIRGGAPMSRLTDVPVIDARWLMAGSFYKMLES